MCYLTIVEKRPGTYQFFLILLQLPNTNIADIKKQIVCRISGNSPPYNSINFIKIGH